MTLLTLKRQNVPLDRDVIALFEAGEEGAVALRHPVHGRQALGRDRVGVLPGRGRQPQPRRAARSPSPRSRRSRRFPAPSPSPRAARPATARCRCGRTPSSSSPRRSRRWRSGSRRSASTRRRRPTSSAWPRISDPAAADRYRAILGTDTKAQDAADEYFLDNEPRHASTIRTSISPTMIQAGYRTNVIPSEVAGHARRADDARSGSGGVPRDGEEGRQRPGGRGDLRRPRRPARRHLAAQHRRLRRHRGQRQEALQRRSRCRR